MTTPATPEPTRSIGRARRWLAGGAVAVALSAVLLGGTAFAQTDDDGESLGEAFIQRLAGKLGLTTGELESAIEETQTEMIDEAVASGRLTEEQGARLKERIVAGDGVVGFGFMQRGAHGHHFLMRCLALDTIAEQLGMTTDALVDELQSGATLSEIITEHGSTVEDVVAALVAEAEEELAEAVANGRLTQAQADEILENLPERLTERIENGPSLRFPSPHPFDGDTTDDTDAEETSSSQV
jgi:polyhydroxyalkanoate synthesis regulator phasin